MATPEADVDPQLADPKVFDERMAEVLKDVASLQNFLKQQKDRLVKAAAPKSQAGNGDLKQPLLQTEQAEQQEPSAGAKAKPKPKPKPKLKIKLGIHSQTPSWAFTEQSKVAYQAWISTDPDAHDNKIGHFCGPANKLLRYAFLYGSFIKFFMIWYASMEPRAEGRRAVCVAVISTIIILVCQIRAMHHFFVPWKALALKIATGGVEGAKFDLGFKRWFATNCCATAMAWFFKISTFANIGCIVVSDAYGMLFKLAVVVVGSTIFLDLHCFLVSRATPYVVGPKEKKSWFRTIFCSWCIWRRRNWRPYKVETEEVDVGNGPEQQPKKDAKGNPILIPQTIDYSPCDETTVLTPEQSWCTWGERVGATHEGSTHFENVFKFGRSIFMDMAVSFGIDYPLMQIKDIQAQAKKPDPEAAEAPDGHKLVTFMRCYHRARIIMRESIQYSLWITLFGTVPKVILQVVSYHRLLQVDASQIPDVAERLASHVPLWSIIIGFISFFFTEIWGQVQPIIEVWKLFPEADAEEAMKGADTLAAKKHVAGHESEWAKVNDVGNDAFKAREKMELLMIIYVATTSISIILVCVCMVQFQCDLGLTKLCLCKNTADENGDASP